MEYVNQAEQLGKRVKNLRSDNGGEYWLNVFDGYLKTKGITYQTIEENVTNYFNNNHS